jgi:putative transposase
LLPIVGCHEPITSYIRLKYIKNNEPNKQVIRLIKYPAGIRKLFYTTNTIEGYHRQIRKATKNKGVFTSDMALLKLIYLATERIGLKWNKPLTNWAIAAPPLKIIFGTRMKKDL